MEYNIEFSGKLIEAAKVLQDSDSNNKESNRAILYLSLLSCEISLKALLEKAGMPVKEIQKWSHDLKGLLEDLGKCEVQVDFGSGVFHGVPTSQIRSIEIDKRFGNATVGNLLQAESQGASKYPKEIRYGDLLTHFSAPTMLKCAIKILEWATSHWNDIRLKSKVK